MPLPSIIAIDHTGIHAAYVSPMNEILRDISMPALATMSPKTAASRVICSSFISKTARFCNGPFIGWKLNDAFATIRDYAQPVEYFQDLKCYHSNYRLAQITKNLEVTDQFGKRKRSTEAFDGRVDSLWGFYRESLVLLPELGRNEWEKIHPL
jgi:hypothetical protein